MAHVDAASGAGQDSFAFAIGHEEDGFAVIDLLHERRPPFSPEGVIAEVCDILRIYGPGKKYPLVILDFTCGYW